jgi:hypothetical protein
VRRSWDLFQDKSEGLSLHREALFIYPGPDAKCVNYITLSGYYVMVILVYLSIFGAINPRRWPIPDGKS